MFGFVVVFIIAYLIKARDSEMLGALLMICFVGYLIASSHFLMGNRIKPQVK